MGITAGVKMLFGKSRVRQHARASKTGKVETVKEHQHKNRIGYGGEDVRHREVNGKTQYYFQRDGKESDINSRNDSNYDAAEFAFFQILNGGFEQAIMNGRNHDELGGSENILRAAERFFRHYDEPEAADLFEAAQEHVDDYMEWMDDRSEDADEEYEGVNVLDNLDTKLYKLDEEHNLHRLFPREGDMAKGFKLVFGKSVVKQHPRTSKTGKTSTVKQYSDKRTKKPGQQGGADGDARDTSHGKKPKGVQITSIDSVDRHRNGTGGAAFDVVKFKYLEPGTEEERNMMGVVFEQGGHVAVFDTDLVGQGNTSFGSNSWRGDQFEKQLRQAVAQQTEDLYGHLREGGGEGEDEGTDPSMIHGVQDHKKRDESKDKKDEKSADKGKEQKKPESKGSDKGGEKKKRPSDTRNNPSDSIRDKRGSTKNKDDDKSFDEKADAMDVMYDEGFDGLYKKSPDKFPRIIENLISHFEDDTDEDNQPAQHIKFLKEAKKIVSTTSDDKEVMQKLSQLSKKFDRELGGGD